MGSNQIDFLAGYYGRQYVSNWPKKTVELYLSLYGPGGTMAGPPAAVDYLAAARRIGRQLSYRAGENVNFPMDAGLDVGGFVLKKGDPAYPRFLFNTRSSPAPTSEPVTSEPLPTTEPTPVKRQSYWWEAPSANDEPLSRYGPA